MLGQDCWFCDRGADPANPLLFDWEFDTPVHASCIASALEKDPNNEEAQLMVYLLRDDPYYKRIYQGRN